MSTSVAAATVETGASEQALFTYCLRLADDALICGQRLAEWSSKAPSLELDIALSNQSLDLFGQARMLYDYAARVEGKGRSEDDLAFLRDGLDFTNLLMVELPNGDFAHTTVRQFLFSARNLLAWEGLTGSADAELAAIAAKTVKELTYHMRHSGEWMVRLGDGTDESHARAQAALDALWPYTGEMFKADALDAEMTAAGIGFDPQSLHAPWLAMVEPAIARATLARPDDGHMHGGGRKGRHSEHLGYILAEMQYLQRTYPGSKW
jgi:ring-1,2-phenylacetyl-CoA epoxidase subunit PaaC